MELPLWVIDDVFVNVDADTRQYSGLQRSRGTHDRAQRWSSGEAQRVRDLTTSYAGEMAETLQYGRSVLNGSAQDGRDAQTALAAAARAPPCSGRGSGDHPNAARYWNSAGRMSNGSPSMLERHPIVGVEYVRRRAGRERRAGRADAAERIERIASGCRKRCKR